MADYIITEMPDKHFDRETGGKIMQEEIRKMVNDYPKMFTGKKWDKWRDKEKEEENGVE
jgi:hypothetical protein